jgi:hypothetical protein
MNDIMPETHPSQRFPPGVLNTVVSLGSVGGAAISSHLSVDKVAFTGSTLTGRKIMEAAAKSNLKKVTLELGGKSPHLIFESADLEEGKKPFQRALSSVHTEANSLILGLQRPSGRRLEYYTILAKTAQPDLVYTYRKAFMTNSSRF